MLSVVAYSLAAKVKIKTKISTHVKLKLDLNIVHMHMIEIPCSSCTTFHWKLMNRALLFVGVNRWLHSSIACVLLTCIIECPECECVDFLI